MTSNYKKLGPFIRPVSIKNKDLKIDTLLGVSIRKVFIPSIANTIGTDMSNYKVVRKNQFAYGPVTSRNGERISIALLGQPDCIISTSYTVFEIIDHNELDPEYLMMWFSRPEFDRYARFRSHGSVREMFDWEEMCDVELPVPHIDKQREIVRKYNVIVDRIHLNEQLCAKLEDTAQALYKHWFVDFEFPISADYAQSIGKPELEGKPYKSNGGTMKYCEKLEKDIPKDWNNENIDKIVTITRGASPRPIHEFITNQGTPWVKIADATKSPTKFLFNTNEYINDYGVEKSRIIEIGTLILSNSASPGLPMFMQVRGCVHDGWLIFKNFKNITKQYMYYFLLHHRTDILTYGNGSVFKNLKTDILKSYQILIPTEETSKLANLYFDSIDNKIFSLSVDLTILVKLKNIIFSKMSKLK